MAQIERRKSLRLPAHLLDAVHRQAAAAGLSGNDFVARCLENRSVFINGKTHAIAALARIESWICSGQCSREQILEYIKSEMNTLGAAELGEPGIGATAADYFESMLGERSE